MAKAGKTWKLVLTSVILSILILAAFTAVFISLIVPTYNISREQIYNVLTKALPILIGLIFIEIALISSRRGEDDYRDNLDKLAPNAYDSPLYTQPTDDPRSAKGFDVDGLNVSAGYVNGVRTVTKEVPVEVVKEVVKEVPVEVVREVPVEVEVTKEVPVEVVKEIVKEVPVEVIKEVEVPVIKEVEKIVEVPSEPEIIIKEVEVPVEVIKEVEVIREIEVPVDVIKETFTEGQGPAEVKEIEKIVEVPVEVIKEVEVPVEVIKEVEKIVEVPVEVVKEVEVPVIKEVEKIVEVPVEVIKEVEVVKEVEKTVEVPAEAAEATYSFTEALEGEIAEAKAAGYPLTVLGFKNGDEAAIAAAFESPVFTEGGKLFVILPFTRVKDVIKEAKEMGGNAVQMAARHTAASIIKEAGR